MDGKYAGEIRKADTGEVVPADEWILFRAKDDAVPAMLRAYAIALLHHRVLDWRSAHPDLCKVPD